MTAENLARHAEDPNAPMARGFVYLAVVLDWFSRRLLAWRLSITMEASFCVQALEDALAHHDRDHLTMAKPPQIIPIAIA
jgi:transposase InsO family protein